MINNSYVLRPFEIFLSCFGLNLPHLIGLVWIANSKRKKISLSSRRQLSWKLKPKSNSFVYVFQTKTEAQLTLPELRSTTISDHLSTSDRNDLKPDRPIQTQRHKTVINFCAVMSFLALPIEMIDMIFKQLNDLNELLKCRLLSRRCKEVVDGIRITGGLTVKLPTSANSLFPRFTVLKHQLAGNLIGPSSVCFRAKILNLLESSSFTMEMLARLRKLAIDSVSFTKNQDFLQFQININRLNKLEHLQIGELFLAQPGTLQFDHIRTFAIFKYCTPKAVLIAPKLTKLVLLGTSFSVFKLVDTDELTHLVLSYSGWVALSSSGSYPKDKIKKLQFETDPFQVTNLLNIIPTHPALNELHVQSKCVDDVCKMLNQKKVHRNQDLIIYFSGIRIDQISEAEQLVGGQGTIDNLLLPYVVENFERISLIDWFRRVNYSELIGYSDRLSANSFLSKFIYIQQVTVGRTIDSVDKLIEFLRKLRYLKDLFIQNSPLSQSFYDALHTHCRSLEILEIECTELQEFDLKFLLRHNQLKRLRINRELDFVFINDLIQQRSNKIQRYNLRFQLKGTWVTLCQEYSAAQFEFEGQTLTYSHSNNLNKPFNVALALQELKRLI